MTTYYLTIAAIKMFMRNRQALFFTLFMPFVIMLIFGYIGFDKPPVIDVSLVSHAPNAPTASFVEQIRKFPTFKVTQGTLDEERAKLLEGSRSAVIDIPDDLLGSPVQGGTPKAITVYVNEGQQGQAQAVLSILRQFADKVTLSAAKAPTLITVNEQVVNSHNLRYIEFLLPGLIALSIMQMSVFSVAFVFTQYKEKGVLKRLLATPMLPYQFVIANIITRLIVALVQTAIFIILGVFLFNANILGSYWLVFLCAILGALMFLGLGFSVSGLSTTVDSVPAIANLIVFPMFFLGGVFFSISNMPPWLQSVAQYLPLTYFSSALRDVMTKGATIVDVKKDILGMLAWAIILVALATITFSFQEKENA